MNSDQDDAVGEERGMEIRFSSPLWMQRRQFIRQVIDENKATSVIDYGCGEAALTSILIGETWQDHQIRRIACVDIDLDCVTSAASACQPQEYDLGDGLRVHDLTIDLYQGSVSEADQRLMGYDALACVEVIEHLHPDTLTGFWKTVLGAYSPGLVIVTTPNAEFNVNFPQLMYGTPDSTFRHWDHKFEWTRKEFEEWCTSAAHEYGYSASFTGVGNLPNQGSDIGTIHSEAETLIHLHETIGYLRARPPKTADLHEHWNYFHEPEDPEGKIAAPEDEKEAVLGLLAMEYLWSSGKTRQYCRSRSNMVELLQTSPLVQVDVEQDLITFDDDHLFWKECDDRYDAARAEEDKKFRKEVEEAEETMESSDNESNDDDYCNDVDNTFYPETVGGWAGASTWGDELGTEAVGWGSRAWDQPYET
ncbi:Small RNA 2'-O-methyltransferase [Podila epicladia]|nr:Small RNA 2'-O-methyltransferase [Podila epicladia]